MGGKGHKSRRPKRRWLLPLLALITAALAVITAALAACTALIQLLAVIVSLHM